MSRRPIATGLLLLTIACSTVTPVAQPRTYIPAKKPKTVYLTTTDRPTPLVLNGPRVLGDTLVGFVEGEYRELPLSTVRSVEARELDKKRTILTTALAASAGAALVIFLAGGFGSAEEELEEDDIGHIVRLRR